MPGWEARGRGRCVSLAMVRATTCPQVCLGAASLYILQPAGGGCGRAGQAHSAVVHAITSHCYCNSFLLVLFCSQLEADADEKGKYARRQGGLQRTMKRVFPGLFQGSLPVTTKWVPPPCLSTDAVLQWFGRSRGSSRAACPSQPSGYRYHAAGSHFAVLQWFGRSQGCFTQPAPPNQVRACGSHFVLHACTRWG